MQKKGGKGNGDPSFPYHIPVDRVAQVIEGYIEKNVERHWAVNPTHKHGHEAVGNLCGFEARRIYSICKREYQSVTFDVVDRIFIGLQCMELWHMPPEEGGFADLYECETVQPPMPPLSEEQQVTREKTNTRRRTDKLKQIERESVAA